MLLLIPGPVMTDPRVRAAAALDYAPWDLTYRDLVVRVRDRMLLKAGGQPGEHVALLLPGSGHFAIEAALRTLVPGDGGILVPDTGEYAQRMARLANEAGRRAVLAAVPDNLPVDPTLVTHALAADPTLTHLAIVYSETSTGIIHDAPALARAAGALGRRVLVDAVSAMGALPFDLGTLPMVDCVTVTANKCFEGLPGLSVSVARIDRLLEGAGRAGSWSLDLTDLYTHTLRAGPGSHRFTPAAQAIAALDVALDLHDDEGAPGRLARYTANRDALRAGLLPHGLLPLLPDAVQGPIVLNIGVPAEPWWDLQGFVDTLKARGVLISNFARTGTPHFRVGCIGAVTPMQMAGAADAMGAALDDLRHASQKAA